MIRARILADYPDSTMRIACRKCDRRDLGGELGRLRHLARRGRAIRRVDRLDALQTDGSR